MPLINAVVAGVIGAIAGWWIPLFVSKFVVRYGEPPRSPSKFLTVPITALTCAVVAYSTTHWAILLAVVAFGVLGVLLAFIDVAVYRLPDPLVWRCAVIAFAGAAIGGHPWRSLAAGAALLTGYLILSLLAGGQIGLGDVKLAGAIGLLLGWYGWPQVIFGALFGLLVNGLVALILLLTRRVGWRSSIPMGPSILVGALAAIALL